MSLKLIKNLTVFVCLLLLSSFSIQSSASAESKVVKEIIDGGKWRLSIASKQMIGFNGTIRFDGKKTVRIFAESHTVQGKYRVSGSKICLQIFRFWGKREKCLPAIKKKGFYAVGNLILR